MVEGLLKIDVPAKKMLGPTPGQIPSEQVGVSSAREATFWGLGAFLGFAFPNIFQNQRKGCQILMSRNASPDPPDPADPPDPPDPGKVVAASAPQTLPSTRAGGQDDVSSNKLPQIN